MMIANFIAKIFSINIRLRWSLEYFKQMSYSIVLLIGFFTYVKQQSYEKYA